MALFFYGRYLLEVILPFKELIDSSCCVRSQKVYIYIISSIYRFLVLPFFIVFIFLHVIISFAVVKIVFSVLDKFMIRTSQSTVKGVKENKGVY